MVLSAAERKNTMTVFLAALSAIVALVIGVFLGGAMNFRNFGSSGAAIIGSGLAFVVTITLAATTTGALSIVGVALASLVAGVLIRGSAS